MSDLAERSKVNLDLWNLFIVIVSLGITYQVRIMTLASTVFEKSSFQKKSHLNALGSKFALATSPMQHDKSQGHRPSGSGEEDF